MNDQDKLQKMMRAFFSALGGFCGRCFWVFIVIISVFIFIVIALGLLALLKYLGIYLGLW
jgi:uncharacterized protein YqhQ